MNQRAILKLIGKEAVIFSKEKKSLEEREEQLINSRNEIANKIREMDDLESKEDVYEVEVKKLSSLINVRKQIRKERNELAKKIEKAKERIISKLKENQEEIFKNRHEFQKVNVRSLKEEKKQLKKELDEIRALKSTTKEELKGMSDEEAKRVEEAQRKYKENIGRIKEIDQEINMANLFCGKKPKEMFERNKVIIKKVEETFNIDKIDTIASDIMKEKKEQSNDNKSKKDSRAEQTPNQNTQVNNVEQQAQQTPNQSTQVNNVEQQAQQTPNQNTDVNNFPQQEEQTYQIDNTYNQSGGDSLNNVYDIGENISIFEAEQVAVFNFGENQQGIVLLKNGKAAKQEKKEMYKRLNIRKRVKGFRNLRKVNPVIIKILEQVENGDMMINQYLQSIRSKSQFNFGLKHDLAGLNIFQRIKKNIQTKREQKCGANIVGKLFDRKHKQNYQTVEQQTVNEPRQSRRREMDSYVRADAETIHRTEQIGQRAGQAIQEESQEAVNVNGIQEDITI